MVTATVARQAYATNRALLKELLECLSKVGDDMHAAMNTFLPHAVQYPMNFVAGNPSYLPQPQQIQQSFGIQPASRLTVPGVTIPLNTFLQHQHQQQQQQQTQELNKLLQFSVLQHQFIQNFAFTNCGNYHPHIVPRAHLHKKSKSSPDICEEIKQEILKHLQPGVASSLTSDSPQESLSSEDQSLELEESEEDLDDSMNRGMK